MTDTGGNGGSFVFFGALSLFGALFSFWRTLCSSVVCTMLCVRYKEEKTRERKKKKERRRRRNLHHRHALFLLLLVAHVVFSMLTRKRLLKSVDYPRPLGRGHYTVHCDWGGHARGEERDKRKGETRQNDDLLMFFTHTLCFLGPTHRRSF
jgi:hypothetical protein